MCQRGSQRSYQMKKIVFWLCLLALVSKADCTGLTEQSRKREEEFELEGLDKVLDIATPASSVPPSPRSSGDLVIQPEIVLNSPSPLIFKDTDSHDDYSGGYQNKSLFDELVKNPLFANQQTGIDVEKLNEFGQKIQLPRLGNLLQDIGCKTATQAQSGLEIIILQFYKEPNRSYLRISLENNDSIQLTISAKKEGLAKNFDTPHEILIKKSTESDFDSSGITRALQILNRDAKYYNNSSVQRFVRKVQQQTPSSSNSNKIHPGPNLSETRSTAGSLTRRSGSSSDLNKSSMRQPAVPPTIVPAEPKKSAEDEIIQAFLQKMSQEKTQERLSRTGSLTRRPNQIPVLEQRSNNLQRPSSAIDLAINSRRLERKRLEPQTQRLLTPSGFLQDLSSKLNYDPESFVNFIEKAEVEILKLDLKNSRFGVGVVCLFQNKDHETCEVVRHLKFFSTITWRILRDKEQSLNPNFLVQESKVNKINRKAFLQWLKAKQEIADPEKEKGLLNLLLTGGLEPERMDRIHKEIKHSFLPGERGLPVPASRSQNLFKNLSAPYQQPQPQTQFFVQQSLSYPPTTLESREPRKNKKGPVRPPAGQNLLTLSQSNPLNKELTRDEENKLHGWLEHDWLKSLIGSKHYRFRESGIEQLPPIVRFTNKQNRQQLYFFIWNSSVYKFKKSLRIWELIDISKINQDPDVEQFLKAPTTNVSEKRRLSKSLLTQQNLRRYLQEQGTSNSEVERTR